MNTCPRNGSVVTVIHDGVDKRVYWVRDSKFGKAGGAYFDGRDYFAPDEFTGWRAV
jgi:S-adenosylmethionine hydrolase